MGRTARVEVTGIAAGGAGVGRLPDGRVIFVQRTAPGDVAEVRVVQEKRSWARGELVTLTRAAPERRDAPCPYYDRCGGCTLEHLEYDAQRRAKGRIVAEAFRRIGGVEVEVPEVVAAPEEFRYRNRVSFTLLRLRGDRVVAGFHALGRPGRIVDMDEACLLPEAPVAEVWGRIRRAWGPNASRLPSGRKLRLTVRATAVGAAGLLVEGGYGPGAPEELVERVAGLEAVWHKPGRGGALIHRAGRERLRDEWMGESIELGGDVFLQVNRGTAELLERHVEALAGSVDGRRVVDAYCGVGIRARRLARRGARVTGIEWDAAAVAAGREGAPEGVEFLVGAVEERLAEALPAALVVVNPPRTGLDRAVPEILKQDPPERLIYVSCDPATLARDVERLGPDFRLRSLRCFDMFPQTSHVETVAELACDTL